MGGHWRTADFHVLPLTGILSNHLSICHSSKSFPKKHVFWLNTLSKYINHAYLSTFCTLSFSFLSAPFHSTSVLLCHYIRSTSLSVVAPASSRRNFSTTSEISNIFGDTIE